MSIQNLNMAWHVLSGYNDSPRGRRERDGVGGVKRQGTGRLDAGCARLVVDLAEVFEVADRRAERLQFLPALLQLLRNLLQRTDHVSDG